MTILEAIKSVLENEPDGLTCKAITNHILTKQLYTFKAKDPNAIVGQCIRRHCCGLDFPSAHPVKHFTIVSGNRGSAVYSLLNHSLSNGLQSRQLPVSASSDLLPEEKMLLFYNEHKRILKDQLIDMILRNDPKFFEHLVVKLLIALGYGYGSEAGKVVGKSHDGGIDGVINEDKLGLDKIYIQAKRYDPERHIGSKDIQAFSGAMKKVNKGVFITTSSFTREAKKEVNEQVGKQIALIDGSMLTELMIGYGIGIRSVQSFETYEIDFAFFDPDQYR